MHNEDPASIWVLGCHALLLPLAAVQAGIVIYTRIYKQDNVDYEPIAPDMEKRHSSRLLLTKRRGEDTDTDKSVYRTLDVQSSVHSVHAVYRHPQSTSNTDAERRAPLA